MEDIPLKSQERLTRHINFCCTETLKQKEKLVGELGGDAPAILRRIVEKGFDEYIQKLQNRTAS